MDGVLGDMHPEIVWHQAQGLPHGGTYRGLEEVRRNIFDPLDEEWWDEFSAGPDEFLDAGDQVVVVGRYRGVGKQTRQTTGRSRSSISGLWKATRRSGSASSSIPRAGSQALRDLIIDIARWSEETRRSAPTPGLRQCPHGPRRIPR